MNEKTTPVAKERLLGNSFTKSEVVIAFVGAVGVDLRKVETAFAERLVATGYKTANISITEDVIPKISRQALKSTHANEYDRISRMMDLGNRIRKTTKDNGFLSLGAVAQVASIRTKAKSGVSKTAYLIRSLKRPEEVRQLREIYTDGFYLVGVHSDRQRREDYLTVDKRMTSKEASKLMDRDMNEEDDCGQRIIDTFHLSDFFVRVEGSADRLENSVWRIVDLMFAHPHITPAFSEHAMFLAFASSLRSGDLSRQVGAVIAREAEILATGANDCPQAGGGLYWPFFCKDTQSIRDVEKGRDSACGSDSNRTEQKQMIDSIIKAFGKVRGITQKKMRRILENGPISDLTEFGRVVHAEMEALLSCARKGISTKGATMYCTTFPCHNCAKHIVAAGIERVVFIEPYTKSKAIKLHNDSIKIDYSEEDSQSNGKTKVVKFQPFVGVGPRRFFDLFSMRIGLGTPVTRKDSEGAALTWDPQNSQLRIQMLPKSYLDLETEAANAFKKECTKKK